MIVVTLAHRLMMILMMSNIMLYPLQPLLVAVSPDCSVVSVVAGPTTILSYPCPSTIGSSPAITKSPIEIIIPDEHRDEPGGSSSTSGEKDLSSSSSSKVPPPYITAIKVSDFMTDSTMTNIQCCTV